MPHVLLVRHGESEWNATGRWQGQAPEDPGLTPRGRAQARAAVEALGDVDAVVASDLRRAAETAEILAVGLGVGPVVLDAGLRERDAGEWTGLTRAEIEQRWPGALGRREQPAGFETDDELAARGIPAVLRAAAHGPAVVVVTHGGLIGAVERACGADHERIPNLGARAFDVVDGRLVLGDRLLLVDPDAVEVTAPPET